MDWIKYAWRSVLAATTQRNIVPEQDSDAPGDEAPAIPPQEMSPVAVRTAPDQPSLAIDTEGWLVGKGVVKIPTKRPGYTFKTRDRKPGGILWHWTATAWGTAQGMVQRTVEGSGPTVHLWVEHDGTIFQSVSLHRGAGHAGSKSSARLGVDRVGRVVEFPTGAYSANYYLLGCEMVNVGELRWVKKHADGSWARATASTPGAVLMGWPYGKDGKRGPIVKPEHSAVAANGRIYHAYTDAQRYAAGRLVRVLHQHFGWDEEQFMWDHQRVDPTRKSDAGPLWLGHDLKTILRREIP